MNLSDGFALSAECETRFGTTHDMIASFLMANAEVEKLIAFHGSASMKDSYSSLTGRRDVLGFEHFSILSEIVQEFSEIRNMRTLAETKSKPILHMMLPMLKKVERQHLSLS